MSFDVSRHSKARLLRTIVYMHTALDYITEIVEMFLGCCFADGRPCT